MAPISVRFKLAGNVPYTATLGKSTGKRKKKGYDMQRTDCSKFKGHPCEMLALDPNSCNSSQIVRHKRDGQNKDTIPPSFVPVIPVSIHVNARLPTD